MENDLERRKCLFGVTRLISTDCVLRVQLQIQKVVRRAVITMPCLWLCNLQVVLIRAAGTVSRDE